MATYLQGRKVAAVEVRRRPPVELVQLIRKRRWMGMEKETEQLQTRLHVSARAGGVITDTDETD